MSETKKKFDLKESMYFVRSKVASNPKRSLAAGFVFLVLLAASLVLILSCTVNQPKPKVSVQNNLTYLARPIGYN